MAEQPTSFKILTASLAALAFIFSVFAILSIGGAVFSNNIAEPPKIQFVADDPDTLGAVSAAIPDNAEVTVGFQADRLDAAAPRIVWSGATSLIYLGISALTILLTIALQRSREYPLFSDQMHELLVWSYAPLIAIIVGVITRDWTQGWVARAYGADDVAGFASTFETVGILTPLAMILGPAAVGSIWNQGRALQLLSDETV